MKVLKISGEVFLVGEAWTLRTHTQGSYLHRVCVCVCVCEREERVVVYRTGGRPSGQQCLGLPALHSCICVCLQVNCCWSSQSVCVSFEHVLMATKHSTTSSGTFKKSVLMLNVLICILNCSHSVYSIHTCNIHTHTHAHTHAHTHTHTCA